MSFGQNLSIHEQLPAVGQASGLGLYGIADIDGEPAPVLLSIGHGRAC